MIFLPRPLSTPVPPLVEYSNSHQPHHIFFPSVFFCSSFLSFSLLFCHANPTRLDSPCLPSLRNIYGLLHVPSLFYSLSLSFSLSQFASSISCFVTVQPLLHTHYQDFVSLLFKTGSSSSTSNFCMVVCSLNEPG